MAAIMTVRTRHGALAGLAAAIITGLGCVAAEAPDTDAVDGVVTVAGGQISAAPGSADGEVDAYLGIPYAAPPMGELRWRPPHPVEPWDGIREASALPPGCPQGLPVGRTETDDPFFGAGATTFDEDCLYLNVWSSADPGDAVPVMV